MKQLTTSTSALLIALSLGIMLTACRGTTGKADTQATIDAAVAATASAQQALEATIATAVAATATTSPTEAVATPVVISQTINVTTVQTTTVNPTPAAQDYSTMSEEELVALINQTVAQATAATDQYSTATTTATTDSTVTPEEAQTIEVYVNMADEAVNTAEQAMAAYYDLYADLASETQAELEQLNQSLQEISSSVDQMNQTLTEINNTLNEGLALAEETLDSLEKTAQAASAQAAQLQQQAQTWQANYQAQVEQRVNTALNIQATHMADTPQAALQDTAAFLQTAQQALADQQLSADELVTITQLGANAKAGLAAQNIPQLQQLSGDITTMTEQLARGNLSQVRASMEGFSNSLNSAAQLDFTARQGDGALLDPSNRPTPQLNLTRPADGSLVNPPSRPTREGHRP